MSYYVYAPHVVGGLTSIGAHSCVYKLWSAVMFHHDWLLYNTTVV